MTAPSQSATPTVDLRDPKQVRAFFAAAAQAGSTVWVEHSPEVESPDVVVVGTVSLVEGKAAYVVSTCRTRSTRVTYIRIAKLGRVGA
jgi:hypothetical protein